MISLRSFASSFFKSTPAVSRRGKNHQPPESLEERVLLSNVTVSFTRGDLVLTGDSGDNVVEIKRAPNRIIVLGIKALS